MGSGLLFLFSWRAALLACAVLRTKGRYDQNIWMRRLKAGVDSELESLYFDIVDAILLNSSSIR